MPNDKVVQITRRLDDLEAAEAAEQEVESPGDLILNVQYWKTVFVGGERREVPVRYREEDIVTTDCGEASGGGRHLVRGPRTGAVPIEDDEGAASSGDVCPWPMPGSKPND